MSKVNTEHMPIGEPDLADPKALRWWCLDKARIHAHTTRQTGEDIVRAAGLYERFILTGETPPNPPSSPAPPQ